MEQYIGDDGYITDPSVWNEQYAQLSADQLDIEMTGEHWDIIQKFRDYINEYNSTPSARIALRKFGVDSKQFYALFPNGPKQAAMIAGGIKPSGC